jgi:hypothetical protein
MGTLFDQPPRNWCDDFNIHGEIDEIENIINETHLDLTFSDVVSLLTMLQLRRRNNLYVNNGDTFDEQMEGIGELLQKLNNELQNLNNE